MSTKALRKELFAAVAMLIVAAIALSGSTYAWFAANTTVTAEDMQVTVVSDTTFLLIGNASADISSMRSAKSTTAGAVNTEAAIKPAAHIAVANVTAADTVTNWYYNYSNDPANYAPAGANTTLAAFDGYVLVNEFKIGIAEGSNGVRNIAVTACGINYEKTTDKAIRVLVATSEGAVEFGDDGAVVSGNKVIYNTSTITGDTVLPVKVYIYWDGDDTDVFTNNIADLGETSVSLEFSGDIIPQS